MSRPSIHSSLQSNNTSTNSALQARIASKRAELENLKSLRDLSATLAAQMTTLAEKLGTLRDGTEAVACVLANWENVLGVIGMVGAQAARLGSSEGESGVDGDGEEKKEQQKLPETLVRIPVKNGRDEKEEEKESGE